MVRCLWLPGSLSWPGSRCLRLGYSVNSRCAITTRRRTGRHMPLIGWSGCVLPKSRACFRKAEQGSGKLQVPPLRFASVGMTRVGLRFLVDSSYRVEPAPLDLSSRPKRSVVEGPAVSPVLKAAPLSPYPYRPFEGSGDAETF